MVLKIFRKMNDYRMECNLHLINFYINLLTKYINKSFVDKKLVEILIDECKHLGI